MKLLFASAALLLALASTAVAAEPRGITVNGSGAVVTVPNRAEFSFGVTTQAKTATAALGANGAEMTKVIAALKSAGVAASDIRTQLVSLVPRTTPDGDSVVGYTAQNSVAVRIRELGRAGAVVDAAVGAGANEVSGPSLVRSDQGALYQRALRAAIADARRKARTLAAASGVKLGRVLSVTEQGGSPVPLGADAKAVSEGAPIEPGTQTIRADVTVTFAVR